MASLEDRVAQLEGENSALKAALESLTKRLDSMEVNGSSAGAKKATRPKTAARRGSGNGAAAAATTTTKATRPATAKPVSASSSSKRRNSTSSVPKPLQARAKEEKEEVDDSIPANRRGNYNVGKSNIYYILPSEYTKDEKGDFPAREVKTDLTLEYCYGYNGKEAYSNLFYAKEAGKIVYSLAGTGIVANLAAKTQSHFIGHNEDILSLAVHPTQAVVATGQLDPKGKGTPYICIWNESGELVRKITYHERGIIALAFSPDGKYLASIGNDDSHTLALWNWEDEGKGKKGKLEPLVEQMVNKAPVYGVTFNPRPTADDGSELKDQYEFVTVGEKCLKVWTASNLDAKDKKARVLQSRAPSTYSKSKIVAKHFLGIAFSKDGHYFVGSDTGHIYKIKGQETLKFWHAHEGAVSALSATADGIVSGGEDGKIKLWGEDGKEQSVIELADAKKDSSPHSFDFKDGKLLVGLGSNVIQEVDLASGAANKLMDGHSDEVWALAAHPTQPVAVTGAHDKTVRVWNYSTKSMLDDKVLSVKSKVRAAQFSEDGKYLVLGMWDGKVAVIDYDAWTVVFNKKFAKETVDSVTFSPDGSHVAVGSWDQCIYLISVPEGEVKHTIKGHTSSVLMVNYSADGKYLMSNSRDYEVLFWSTATGKRVNKTETADTKWSAWNCFLGWAVQGIWEGAGDGTDINTVDRSKDERSLAAGDDFGCVRLFTYPALAKNSPVKSYPGHSSFVTCVRFTPNSEYLFSTGGNDCGVFQWRHQ